MKKYDFDFDQKKFIKKFISEKARGNEKDIGQVHAIAKTYFEDFLFYKPVYKEIYFELLQIENEFNNLKEFVVQLDKIIIPRIVWSFYDDTDIFKLLKKIDCEILHNLKPIEKLFAILIISNHFKDDKKFDLLVRELQAKFKREIRKFPVKIEFKDDAIQSVTNEPGANGEWWLYPLARKTVIKNPKKGETRNDNTRKKLNWKGAKNQLYDVIRQLKKKELITNSYTEIATFICQNVEGFETNFPTVLKEIQKDQRPIKNKRIDLDLSDLPENDTK